MTDVERVEYNVTMQMLSLVGKFLVGRRSSA
jgi:hypothetical protein